MNQTRVLRTFPAPPADATLPRHGTVLVIEVRGAEMIVAANAPGWSVVFARFSAIDARLLAQVNPDCVMFPLFGRGFDALSVVERIVSLGYPGRLCVVTDPLPAPDMVLRELAAASRGRGLDMVERSI